jgi:hypothetical protein
MPLLMTRVSGVCCVQIAQRVSAVHMLSFISLFLCNTQHSTQYGAQDSRLVGVDQGPSPPTHYWHYCCHSSLLLQCV